MDSIFKKEKLHEHYDKREHAFIKHMILQCYLFELFMTVGHKVPVIQYVDCFSGPWLSKDASGLKDTSIGKSIEVMEKCLKLLNKKYRVGKQPLKARALFIEKESKAYCDLSAFLSEKRKTSPIELHSIKGDFSELTSSVSDWLVDGFAFLFIDPKGWKGIEPQTLTSFLQRPYTELLINFMFDFINRFAGDTREQLSNQMDEIIGSTRHKLSERMSPIQREELITRCYRDKIKGICNSESWTAKVRILDREKSRPKYHLIYLTHHPLGMEKFVVQAEKNDQLQSSLHYMLKEEKKADEYGITDLFADQEPQAESRPDNSELVTQSVISNLPLNQPTKFNRKIMASVLDETDCTIPELQNALKSMLDRGILQTTVDYSKRRTKFIHFEKSEIVIRKI